MDDHDLLGHLTKAAHRALKAQHCAVTDVSVMKDHVVFHVNAEEGLVASVELPRTLGAQARDDEEIARILITLEIDLALVKARTEQEARSR